MTRVWIGASGKGRVAALVAQLDVDIDMLLGGLFVVVSNLIVDMLYALLDSRVRTARR